MISSFFTCSKFSAILTLLTVCGPLAAQDEGGLTTVAVVSAEGVIGEGLTCRPFEAAITQASKTGVDVLFFVWDTEGGRLDVARSIADAINEAPESLRIVSVVRRATGETVCALAASDALLTIEGSDATPVISFSTETTTSENPESPDPIVELGAAIASIAESNGQSAGVYRSLIDPSAVYEGVPNSTGSNSSGLKPLRDSSTTSTLKLTASQAAESGFAPMVSSDQIEALAEALGLGQVKEVRPPNARFKAQARAGSIQFAKHRKLVENYEQAIEDAKAAYSPMQQTLNEANAANPKGMDLTYYFDPQTRRRTVKGESFTEWSNQLKIYRSKLLECQGLIQQAATREKKVSSKVRSLNASAARLATLTCASRPAEIEKWEFSEGKRQSMEDLWSFTVKQLKWCEDYKGAKSLTRLIESRGG